MCTALFPFSFSFESSCIRENTFNFRASAGDYVVAVSGVYVVLVLKTEASAYVSSHADAAKFGLMGSRFTLLSLPFLFL